MIKPHRARPRWIGCRGATVGIVLAGAVALVAADGVPAFLRKSVPENFAPGVVSTPASEVRITFSPDGRRALWGTIGRSGGPGGWEIFESVRTNGIWGPPVAVSFDSAANDFDPSFAPDGAGVYFFSNRAGGLGGDDLYFAPFDAKRQAYGPVENLGPEINSVKDEWAPVVSADGATLLFASDGRGGKGRHDLFAASREGSRWVRALNLEGVNTPEEDFDAAFLEGRSLVLTWGRLDGAAALFFVPFVDGRYGPRQRLDGLINSAGSGAWTFGPSVSAAEPGVLYFSGQRAGGSGRSDIFSIRYSIEP